MARIEAMRSSAGRDWGFTVAEPLSKKPNFPQTDHQAISIAVQRYLA